MTSAWRYLQADGVSAAEGLAFDEAIMSGHGRSDDGGLAPILRLYTYRSHAALCGRYQDLDAEIDTSACDHTGTDFNRRPTGGGAIVMGTGQLGVAVVTRAPARERPKAMLLRFASGIVAGLATIGIHAEFGGKNDLKVGERKIAGLGLYIDESGALLFHASVLADLDVPFMLEVLRIPAAKLGRGAPAAVESRVTTVSRETGSVWTGAALREVLAEGFVRALGIGLTPSPATETEQALTQRLIECKYGLDAWRYQLRPQEDATGSSILKTPEGLVRVYLALHGDTIKSALFAGDFNLVPEPLARFEAALKWSRLEEGALMRRAADACPTGTGLGVDAGDLVEAVLAAGERARRREQVLPDISGSCYFPPKATEASRSVAP